MHCCLLPVAGGNNKSHNLASVECYEMPLNKWMQISPMKQSRSGNALVSCQGFLYALGGFNDSSECLSSMERLTDLEGTWEESPPMLKARRWFAAVNCNNMVYAIGGRFGEDPMTATKTVERFDPDQNEWMYVNEMHTERSAHAACVMHGKIYVVGGVDAENELFCLIECYDPLRDSWSVVGETKHNLYFYGIVIV